MSYMWPARNEALLRARAKQISVNGRMIWHYNCNLCPFDVLHARKNVQIDHIIPVVDPAKGFTDWNDYIEKMFCTPEGFQVLCLEHHDLKTKVENSNRVRKRNVAKKRK